MVLAQRSPASTGSTASGSAKKGAGMKPDYSVKHKVKDAESYTALTGLFFKPFRNGSKAWSGKDKNSGVTYTMTHDRENQLVLKCRSGEEKLALICILKEVTKNDNTFYVGEAEDGSSYYVFRSDRK
jgi:hypothetical protein